MSRFYSRDCCYVYVLNKLSFVNYFLLNPLFVLYKFFSFFVNYDFVIRCICFCGWIVWFARKKNCKFTCGCSTEKKKLSFIIVVGLLNDSLQFRGNSMRQ